MARALDVEIATVGPQLEGPDFWDGVRVAHLDSGDDWLGDAKVVVLPSFVESQPRRLLRAIAAGVPVIASAACGLEGMPGVKTVACGDVDALIEAVPASCRRTRRHPYFHPINVDLTNG
jgi:hypothetical protein